MKQDQLENSEEKQSFWEGVGLFLKAKFNLDEDKASEDDVKDNIRRGVEFQGTNLWVLIFATFVASLGLNVNSAAVIIGAMLISPLMGPIMGIGLSVGINDFELMKRSLRNFGFMVLVSILTSTLYFLISPLSNAQSELLARTTPTTYDVLIAFFGGLAGIVAQSRKDRTSTVIPGVAIATALMPPLCTAGFGLATMQFNYFFGAFYLFFINTVFIALATFVVVRFLKYSKKVFLDPARERRVRRYLMLITIVTLVPSIVVGYRIVERSVFEAAADKYVANVIKFPSTQVLDYKRQMNSNGSTVIEVMMVGEAVSDDALDNARMQLVNYGLDKTELIVHQSGDYKGINISTLSTGYSDLLGEKNKQIAELENQVNSLSAYGLDAKTITKELSVLNPGIVDVALSRTLTYKNNGEVLDTVVVCVLKMERGAFLGFDKKKVEEWLKVRTQTDQIMLFTE